MSFDFTTMLADMNARYTEKRHPRILMTEADFVRIRENLEEPIYAKQMQTLLSHCEALMNEPPRVHAIPDGIRLLSTSRAVQYRIFELTIAYNVTGEEKYAERAYKELDAVAHFPDWNPRHFLDPSEMAFAVALGYDWLFDWLGEERRAVLRTALIELGLKQAMDDYMDRPRSRTYRWYQHMPGDNWKMVCNGGMGCAALAILDEVEGEELAICETVLTLGWASTRKAVEDFYSEVDGDYVESLGYWEYASNFLSYHSMALTTACGTDYGLTDWPGIEKTPYFVFQMCGNTARSFNFGDAGPTILRPFVMFWYAIRLKDPSLASVRLRAIEEGAYDPCDLVYYRPGNRVEMDTLPKNFGGIGRDNATFRSGWEVDDIYAAIHFGRNNVCHAHIDTGTFILEYGGERFFMDLGSDNYNLRPYKDAYRFRAEGHNTLVFNPGEELEQNQNNNDTITRYENTEAYGLAQADMSSAYPGKKVVRSLYLERSMKGVIVADDIQCEIEDTVYWFAHTKAEVALAENGRSAILTIDGKRLWAGVLTEGVCFEVRPAVAFPTSPVPGPAVNADGSKHYQAVNEGVQKLTAVLHGQSAYALRVAFVPLADGETAPATLPALR